MTKRMLIDATHPEETRVAVVTGSRLDEYDFETVVRKQLKGNIYLVKVTRVEPSLQAAFVDFGGNRHGFLPFPEIHPDYYRIPIADREALLAEERALAAEQAAREDEEDAAELAAQGQSIEDFDDEEEDGTEDEANAAADDYVPKHTGSIAEEIARDGVISEPEEDNDEEEASSETSSEEQHPAPQESALSEGAAPASEGGEQPAPEKDDVETVGGDAVEQPVYRSSIKRRYKIQEVIKRNQIMLIQIAKEERGNKGAAVTSYISLPGRYCVLMPNSPRGGGVSRKVSNAKDRQRLKKILIELNVPEGMSVILRTAGVSRSKAEIKRDLDYLLRLWDQIRELTLQSTAPALIYEEGNLIKRAIRDLYRREIDEVHVAGEEAYKTAHDFMRTLMPSHASRIQHYTDNSMPLFFRYQVESQIDEIHSPTVHLKSGGYIVINPTEAMVSIDVNSGRATKGRHIEETALKTNLEAADEVARQLRLRDQGGLIVIDFIDMEDKRNNRIVERRLRDAMQHDRARIQLGRISAFGLLELSRQRLHPSLVETNFETCKHCNGAGLVRTVETTGVMILRSLEEECMRAKSSEIRITAPAAIALYLFNHKREMLSVLEKRYSVKVSVSVDDTLVKPNFQIEGVKSLHERADNRPRRPAPVQTVDMSDLPDIPEDQITDDSTVADDSRFEDEGGDAGDRGDRGGRHHHHGGGGGGGGGRDRGGFGDDGGRRRGRRGGKRRGGRHRDGDRNFGDRGGRPHHGGQGGGQGGHHHGGGEGGGEAFPQDAEQPVFAGASDPQGEGFQPSAEGQPAEGGHQGGGHHQGGERGDRNRGGRRRGGRGRGRDRNRGGDRHGGQRHGQHGGGHHQGGGEGGQPSGDTGGGNESFNNAPQGGNDSPPPRREYSAPQDSGNSMPEAANEGGGDGDGKNRKGWWKRLTE
ncbi:MAG: ribonuclease E/G [Alphaproteobacteria bacterium]